MLNSTVPFESSFARVSHGAWFDHATGIGMEITTVLGRNSR
jgi:hypothetical protein